GQPPTGDHHTGITAVAVGEDDRGSVLCERRTSAMSTKGLGELGRGGCGGPRFEVSTGRIEQPGGDGEATACQASDDAGQDERCRRDAVAGLPRLECPQRLVEKVRPIWRRIVVEGGDRRQRLAEDVGVRNVRLPVVVEEVLSRPSRR